MLYNVASSSALMATGVSRVRMQSASSDTVRYASAFLKLISLCTLTYFALSHYTVMASVHTGAAYSNCGSIAPLYIVFNASCSSPQLILADVMPLLAWCICQLCILCVR